MSIAHTPIRLNQFFSYKNQSITFISLLNGSDMMLNY